MLFFKLFYRFYENNLTILLLWLYYGVYIKHAY